jgi:hypothetical protein
LKKFNFLKFCRHVKPKKQKKIAIDICNMNIMNILYIMDFKNSLEFCRAIVNGNLDEIIQEINLDPSVVNKMCTYENLNYDNIPIFCTPLFLASNYGDTAVVDILLQHGARVNFGTPIETPLYIASKNGNVAIVDLLLRNGANPNRMTLIDRDTPLMVASRYNHTEIVKMLLQSDADRKAINKRGHTAQRTAEILGRHNVINTFNESGKRNMTVAAYDALEKKANETGYYLTNDTAKDLYEYLGGRKKTNKRKKTRQKKSRRTRR